nr:hypothetical protein [Burkholderiaceae bacterium]
MPVVLPRIADAEPPTDTLHDWAVFEVLIPELGEPTVHVVGYIRCDGEGRALSPVQGFDSVTRCVATRSGSVYRLAGIPGMSSDAEYVWSRWRRLWSVTVLEDRTRWLRAEFEAAEVQRA